MLASSSSSPHRSRLGVRLGAAFVLASFVAVGTADAYVLPALFLMRTLAEKRRALRVKDLSVQFSTERVGAGGTDGDTIDEHLFLKHPSRSRRVEEGEGGNILVEKEGVFAAGTEGKLRRLAGKTIDLTATLFVPGDKDLDQSSARMIAMLKRVGIDTEITALGRNGDRYVYIIGARSWEPDKPQLWLDKVTFQPVRYIIHADASGKVLIETRLLEWGSSVGSNWFPRVVETYRDGILETRAEAIQVKLNQNLPETLFVIP